MNNISTQVLQLRHRDTAWEAAIGTLFDLDPLHRELSAMFEGLEDLTPYIVETRPDDQVLEECLARHEEACRELLAAMSEARPAIVESIAARFETWWLEQRRAIHRRHAGGPTA